MRSLTSLRRVLLLRWAVALVSAVLYALGSRGVPPFLQSYVAGPFAPPGFAFVAVSSLVLSVLAAAGLWQGSRTAQRCYGLTVLWAAVVSWAFTQRIIAYTPTASWLIAGSGIAVALLDVAILISIWRAHWRGEFADDALARALRPTWQIVRRPPWRTFAGAVVLFMVLFTGYALWAPGTDIRDGRHDRGRNAMWLQHGWLGADQWFVDNKRLDRRATFRDADAPAALAATLREHHITDVYPHLCPANLDGTLPAVDDAQTSRFLEAFGGMRVMPWVGGKLNKSVFPDNPQWRVRFISSVKALLQRHPRLQGIHLNIEPWPGGNQPLLALLEELKAALPAGRILSISAMPPWRHDVEEDYHWKPEYCREVAGRVDQMAVMMYDTALTKSKKYEALMAQWTVAILEAGAPCKEVLLGVPTYDDDTPGHRPHVENAHHALLGIHRGLLQYRTLPKHYAGIAIYCEWEMTPGKWRDIDRYYLARQR